jgi:hypothetical protein
MGIIKIVVGLGIGGLMVSMLKIKKVDKQLSKLVKLVIGLAIGAGVYFFLTCLDW